MSITEGEREAKRRKIADDKAEREKKAAKRLSDKERAEFAKAKLTELVTSPGAVKYTKEKS